VSKLATLVLVALAALAANAQSAVTLTSVHGELQEEGSLIGGRWMVQLRSMGGRTETYQADVRGGGSFEFRNVTPGSYVLAVVAEDGTVVAEQPTEVAMGSFLHVRVHMPAQASANSPARTVPVSQLRNPPSRKTQRALEKAKRLSDAGDRPGAVRELEHAASELPGDAYVRTNLGLEYMNNGNLPAAKAVFEEAARLLPQSPMTRGNLAYVYYAGRQWSRAQAEARAALALDRANLKMRYLLGASLLAEGNKVEEGIEVLKAVRDAVPQAHVMLAQYYLREGRPDAARQELDQYRAQVSGADRETAERWLASSPAAFSTTLRSPRTP
jgi:Tfp pilus assembly protein PilF